MRSELLALAIAGVISATPVSAPASPQSSFFSGSELLTECEKEATDYFSDGVCGGYIVGSIGGEEWGLSLAQSNHPDIRQAFCVPVGVTNKDFRDVVVKFLNNNPEKRHFSATSIIGEALAIAFPC